MQGIALCPPSIPLGGRGVYKNTREAYTDIIRKDGVLGLWRGYIPNLIRNSIVCSCELAGYDQSKEVWVAISCDCVDAVGFWLFQG